MKHSICIILSFFFIINCGRKKEIRTTSAQPNCTQNKYQKKEWNGVNLVAISTQIDSSHFSPILDIEANSVAIIPFGFIRNGKSEVEYDMEWQWFGEKIEGTIHQIKLAQKAGLKVILKPHLWVLDGWVGDLEFETETEWKTFEKTYSKFILDFAKVADSMNTDMLCVGVELRKTVDRKEFWFSLIDSLKTIYKGKLTYAANWDNYNKVTFWSKLDYIGIDAYFPLSEEKTPSVSSYYKSWKKNYQEIKKLSIAENKKIVFTEFGYRNTDFNGKEPWDMTKKSTNTPINQTNAYQALFCRFWNESWFAGGFLWKWYPNHKSAGGKDNNRFTPQNKPAEKLIYKVYREAN